MSVERKLAMSLDDINRESAKSNRHRRKIKNPVDRKLEMSLDDIIRAEHQTRRRSRQKFARRKVKIIVTAYF